MVEDTTMRDYLIIMEDGEVVKTNEITDDELQAADDHYATLIDITEPAHVLEYVDGQWQACRTSNDHVDHETSVE